MAKDIYVYADWQELNGPCLMGILRAEQLKGKEVLSFQYEKKWLENPFALELGFDLQLYEGAQYVKDPKNNFGLFTDSSPDRWGRVLMQRREAYQARREERKSRVLQESDYLLGVSDLYRMGGLRYKLTPDGPFLDNNQGEAAPPIAKLRTLQEASLKMEEDEAEFKEGFAEWIKLLIAPGSSLGGARPKASVIDEHGHLWIAKFPKKDDDKNIGAWEWVLHELARHSGITVAQGDCRKFGHPHHTYLTKRFDRTTTGERIHFASAMTLLGHTDGADATIGVSYLHIAELIMRITANPEVHMEELWRRIIFNICVSNSDDHLRNHGFLLTNDSWVLSPAYDLNPSLHANGLSLNITEDDNSLDLDLALGIAPYFRINEQRAILILKQVTKTVNQWQQIAANIGIPRGEILRMESAFGAVVR